MGEWVLDQGHDQETVALEIGVLVKMDQEACLFGECGCGLYSVSLFYHLPLVTSSTHKCLEGGPIP